MRFSSEIDCLKEFEIFPCVASETTLEMMFLVLVVKSNLFLEQMRMCRKSSL